MINLQNKDISIQEVWSIISNRFGVDFFTLVDFWDADSCALGFTKGEKLIYISTWHYRANKEREIKCYAEFELIDVKSLEPKRTIKQMHEISLREMLNEIGLFLKLSPE